MKTTVLVDNLSFPESPRWHEGKLWFSNIFLGQVMHGQVMHVDLQGDVHIVFELADAPSGFGWTPDGRLLIVSAQARRLLRLEDEVLVEVADLSDLVAFPCNDVVVDRRGRAYIGNMGYHLFDPDSTPRPAPIVSVSPDTSEGTLRVAAQVVAESLAFPNGMVITPDGQTLIVAESYGARLTAFSIEPDGSLSRRWTWAQFDNDDHLDGPATFSEGQITPDGICLDAAGAVWVASPNTNEVLRVLEGAEITHRIPMSTIPIACMLGGPQRRTLFITTIESFDPNGVKAAGHAGRIETIQVDVPGAGLP